MEEKRKNVEVQGGGLLCDNTDNCDWSDSTIPFEDYVSWVNKPCPKCGENILTESDFNLAKTMRATVDFVNTLSEEELNDIGIQLGVDKLNLKNNPLFKDAKGIDDIKLDGLVQISVHGHNGFKITDIKNIEEDGSEIN